MAKSNRTTACLRLFIYMSTSAILGLTVGFPDRSWAEPTDSMVRMETFDGVPSGLLGCVESTSSFDSYCLAALTRPDGKLSIFLKSWSGPYPRVPVTERALQSGGLAISSDDETGNPQVELAIRLPTTGMVTLTARNWGQMFQSFASDGCGAYPLVSEVLAESAVVAGFAEIRGRIDGQAVQNWSYCDTYFVGEADGAWRMVGGL